MEVRSANRGRGDFYNRVRRLFDFRIGNRIHSDVVFAVPAECSHRSTCFGLFAFVDAEQDRIAALSALTRNLLSSSHVYRGLRQL